MVTQSCTIELRFNSRKLFSLRTGGMVFLIAFKLWFEYRYRI
jgi:hypothetical protein